MILFLKVQNDLQVQRPSNTKALPKLYEKLLDVLNVSKVEDRIGIIERLAVDIKRPNFVMILKRILG